MNTLPESRWHPSPFIQASALLHAGAMTAMALNPDAWPWGLGAIAADHALLTLAGLLPCSDWLGPNWRCLPADAKARGEIAITLDDGPDKSVTSAVLDLLDRWDAKVSFFCIAERALHHPDLVGEIIRRGPTAKVIKILNRRDLVQKPWKAECRSRKTRARDPASRLVRSISCTSCHAASTA